MVTCKNESENSDLIIKMYGPNTIALATHNKYSIKSYEFGSDCSECYPSKTDNILIFNNNNDTIGTIMIHYNTPFPDSTTINNISSNEFGEICSSIKSKIGKKTIWDTLLVQSVSCQKINSIESILTNYNGHNAVLLQLFKNQEILYRFESFEDSISLINLVNSVTLTKQ